MIGGDGINDESNKTAPAPMDYFATMVYLTCGKLDLKAVTTSPSVRVFCKLARTRTSSQLV